MKIINHQPDPTVIKTEICKRCGITFQFLPVEVKTEVLYSMCEYAGSYDYISCPSCNNRITIK